MKANDIYSLITNRIIEKIEKGGIPWQKGFNSVAPQNYLSQKPYRGINYWITLANDFESPYYLTFKQTKELGGSIKPGEKGTPIVYWQILQKEIIGHKGETEKKNIPLLKYYTVFNAEQIIGIDFPKKEIKVSNVQSLDLILQKMMEQPLIKHNHSYTPSYSPMLDIVKMPLKNSFLSTENYYQTLFHELGHWTGASNRLNRDGVTKLDHFGSHQYSIEELVAEMTSTYAMNYAGLEAKTLDHSASYIQSWLNVLKNDPKFVFKAAKEAELAWKYIKGEIMSEMERKEAA